MIIRLGVMLTKIQGKNKTKQTACIISLSPENDWPAGIVKNIIINDTIEDTSTANFPNFNSLIKVIII